jgi:hypothetical protein
VFCICSSKEESPVKAINKKRIGQAGAVDSHLHTLTAVIVVCICIDFAPNLHLASLQLQHLPITYVRISSRVCCTFLPDSASTAQALNSPTASAVNSKQKQNTTTSTFIASNHRLDSCHTLVRRTHQTSSVCCSAPTICWRASWCRIARIASLELLVFGSYRLRMPRLSLFLHPLPPSHPACG